MGVNVDHAFPSRKRSVAANLTQPECEHSPPFESHQGLEVAELPATPMSIETPCSEGATANETPRYLFSETLKKSLWDSYVVYVHPLFPIIDVTTRQEEPIGYFIRQGNERLSPLVFLSILYSAVPHVNMEFLEAEGYESREELGVAIRKDFKVCFCSNPPWNILIDACASSFKTVASNTTGGIWHTPFFS